MFADRPAHSSLSHWHWDAYEMTDNSVTKLMLVGITDQTIDDVIGLAKSWTNAPDFVHASDVILNAMYNQEEKAYVLNLSEPTNELLFEIHASKESPLNNPAFVINNWGDADILMSVNGEPLERGEVFRYGYRQQLETADLIIWLKKESEETNEIRIMRK